MLFKKKNIYRYIHIIFFNIVRLFICDINKLPLYLFNLHKENYNGWIPAYNFI